MRDARKMKYSSSGLLSAKPPKRRMHYRDLAVLPALLSPPSLSRALGALVPPRKMLKLPESRKRTETKSKRKKKADETTKKTTKQDGANHDANRKKRKNLRDNRKKRGNEKQHQEQEYFKKKRDIEDFDRKRKATSPENQTGQKTRRGGLKCEEIAQKSPSKGPYAGLYDPTALNFINRGAPAKINRVTLISEIC